MEVIHFIGAMNGLMHCHIFLFTVSVGRYVEMLSAGLAGSPHMISATILGLSRVIFEFKGKVGHQESQ